MKTALAKHIVLYHYQKNAPLIEALETTYSFLNVSFNKERIEEILHFMKIEDDEQLKKEQNTFEGGTLAAILNFIESAKHAIITYGECKYETEVKACEGYIPHGYKYLRAKKVLPKKKWWQF